MKNTDFTWLFQKLLVIWTRASVSVYLNETLSFLAEFQIKSCNTPVTVEVHRRLKLQLQRVSVQKISNKTERGAHRVFCLHMTEQAVELSEALGATNLRSSVSHRRWGLKWTLFNHADTLLRENYFKFSPQHQMLWSARFPRALKSTFESRDLLHSQKLTTLYISSVDRVFALLRA